MSNSSQEVFDELSMNSEHYQLDKSSRGSGETRQKCRKWESFSFGRKPTIKTSIRGLPPLTMRLLPAGSFGKSPDRHSRIHRLTGFCGTETEGEHTQEGSLQHAIETLEQQMVRDALEKAGFNQTQAAKLLGLSERMLRYKLKEYGFK